MHIVSNTCYRYQARCFASVLRAHTLLVACPHRDPKRSQRYFGHKTKRTVVSSNVYSVSLAQKLGPNPNVHISKLLHPGTPTATGCTYMQAVKTDGSSIGALAGCGVGMDVCRVNSSTCGPMSAVATSAGLSIAGPAPA